MKGGYISLAFFIATIALLGCDGQQEQNNTATANDSLSSKPIDSIQPPNVQIDCLGTVKEFLNWYKQHHARISEIQLVALSANDTTGIYRVNFDSTAKYLNYLRESGYFSDTFLAGQLAYFKKADQQLLQSKQNDGPPEGFEYDLLLFTQEPTAVFDKLPGISVKEIRSGLYEIISVDNNILVQISVTNAKCFIDKLTFKKK